MTKNGKPFTFLFKRSSNSKIYIRRFEVSRGVVQNGSLLIAFILFSTLLGGGIYGVAFGKFDLNVENAASLVPPASAQTAIADPASKRDIDYSRPDAADDFDYNSGGPVDPDEVDVNSPELEKYLKNIQSTSNASYIPSQWAHTGKINNEFGFRRNPFGGRTYEFHGGMDIDGERGDMVIAPASGVVSEAGWKGGYGNMIEIDHGNGLKTRYGHLSKIEVETGAQITRGQLIGLVGSTGRSTGPHLHYELRVNSRPINPRYFLPPEPTDIRKL
jgi:murein DD-endopeptidase MepM/ murein hydrolase activator NlpD